MRRHIQGYVRKFGNRQPYWASLAYVGGAIVFRSSNTSGKGAKAQVTADLDRWLEEHTSLSADERRAVIMGIQAETELSDLSSAPWSVGEPVEIGRHYMAKFVGRKGVITAEFGRAVEVKLEKTADDDERTVMLQREDLLLETTRLIAEGKI